MIMRIDEQAPTPPAPWVENLAREAVPPVYSGSTCGGPV